LLAYLFNWLLILLANCWPKCYAKLQLPFAGLWGQVFFLLVSALIFPQLPASYQCCPQSLWQRFLAGKGAAFDLIIVIEGLPLSAATTLSSFWRRTSNRSGDRF